MKLLRLPTNKHTGGEQEKMSFKPLCWVLFDAEKVGSKNQAQGLAEELSLSYELKPISFPKALRFLPRLLWPFVPGLRAFFPRDLRSPLPKILISSGTWASIVAACLRRYGKGSFKAINLLNPRLPLSWFDWVITPAHDHVYGPNVIETLGALHRVTASSLKEAADKFREHPETLNFPIISVLIGGSSRRATLTPDACAKLGTQVAHLHQEKGATLLVTFSRRTSPACKDAFKKALGTTPCHLYDGQGDNPYFAYLGLADFIVVTEDSISMVTEACFTGKPVLTYPVKGLPSKFKEFHNTLQHKGCTRPFKGLLETWEPPPLRERDRVAALLRQSLGDLPHGER